MKKELMVIVDYFIGAAICAGVSVLLMTHYPDAWDSQVLNPAIALAKHVLPVMTILLLLEGAWRLGLLLAGRQPHGLGSSLITRVLERWNRKNAELGERLARGKAGGSDTAG